jgi:hypothetical protein
MQIDCGNNPWTVNSREADPLKLSQRLSLLLERRRGPSLVNKPTREHPPVALPDFGDDKHPVVAKESVHTHQIPVRCTPVLATHFSSPFPQW